QHHPRFKMSIQSMRDNSDGIVAKVIVGLIIIVFALFGMGSITTFLAPTPKVATVNGEDVTQQEMELQVERTRRLLLAQNQNPAAIDEDQLRADVLDNLIARKLMATAASDLGLSYGNARLDAEIVETEVFQVDGVYNPEQFRLLLNSAGFTPTGYREEMRLDKVLAQMGTAIQSTAFMTEAEAKRATSLSQQTRDIAYLRVVVEDLLEEVTVTDEDIESYYDANPASFMTEETVNISYVEIKKADLMDDIAIDEQALENFFYDTQDIYAEPERRRLAHILIEITDEQTEAEAKEKVDAIYAQIIDGADFAELARSESNDPGSAEVGGDLGFTDPGTFVPEFEEVGYNLGLNQMSEPVLTEFGYHIIKLLDIEEAKEPVLAEVREKVEQAYRDAEAEGLFVDLSTQLSELSFESADLGGPADELELEVKSTGHVGRSVTTGFAANVDVMDAAFSVDVLQDGNNSALIEITPNHHAVIRVAEHSPSDLKPLDVVREEVETAVRRNKAEALALEQAEQMVAMLEEGSITRFVADQFGLEWTVVAEASRGARDIDPQINREAFALPRPAEGNKSVGSLVLANGDTAVISVTNVNNPAPADVDVANINSLARVLASREGTSDFQALREYLRAEGKITRN
ncbi:MAG: SurA N-terminal domain-containing protein, partial [Pseudomonadales bacterium]